MKTDMLDRDAFFVPGEHVPEDTCFQNVLQEP